MKVQGLQEKDVHDDEDEERHGQAEEKTSWTHSVEDFADIDSSTFSRERPRFRLISHRVVARWTECNLWRGVKQEQTRQRLARENAKVSMQKSDTITGRERHVSNAIGVNQQAEKLASKNFLSSTAFETAGVRAQTADRNVNFYRANMRCIATELDAGQNVIMKLLSSRSKLTNSDETAARRNKLQHPKMASC